MEVIHNDRSCSRVINVYKQELKEARIQENMAKCLRQNVKRKESTMKE